MAEITVRRGSEEWVFGYSDAYHALQVRTYSVGGEVRFYSPIILESIRYDEIPLPDDVRAEALEKFSSSLRIMRAWPDLAGTQRTILKEGE